jgi:membrane protease YdiL (CAAX protease family)
VKRASPVELLLQFGIPGLLMFLAVRVSIPLLDGLRMFPIEVSWFLSAGLGVLLPMFVAALLLGRREAERPTLATLLTRFRLRRMNRGDWIWTCGAVVAILAATSGLVEVGKHIPGFDASPPFLDDLPLRRETAWIVAAWLPFFFFNIFGEELWWRGYVLPRQELLTGRATWLVHGALWALFHTGLGWMLIFLSTPIFVALPLVVQLRRNTTIGIVIHTVFGAFGFLGLASGLIR